VDGRIEAAYVLPEDETDTPFEKYLDGKEWEFRTSTLHYKPFEDEFWFHIGFKRIEDDTDTGTDSDQADADVPENRTVLGIDLGVETLAVASTGRFWTGDELDHWHREFQQRRGDLQQTGSQEAHRTLQRVSRNETAYYKQYLHIVANEIVEEAVEHDCSVIAFEDLTDIRKRAQGATWHHAGDSTACTSTSNTRPEPTVSRLKNWIEARRRRRCQPTTPHSDAAAVDSPTRITAPRKHTSSARSAATRTTPTTTPRRTWRCGVVGGYSVATRLAATEAHP
jgi:transposase